MGARTTWKVITNNSGAVTWLYSHWGGDSKFVDTRDAIHKASSRWDDPSYGARIFFSSIIGDHDSTTGYGLTATPSNADCPFEESYFSATIDFVNQTVTLGSMTWSFEEFILSPDCSADLTNEFWGEGVV